MTHGRRIALSLDAVAVAFFAALSIQYFAAAMTLAADAPVWMDEILAIWAARVGDPVAIWSALVRGAEFGPPLYDLLLAALHGLGVTSPLGLRMPSIVAIYVAALAIGAIVRRRAGMAPAVLAAGIVLSSGLFAYAVQARSYALVTAVFACALMVYDRAAGETPSWRRTAALTVLLAAAIGLHFYALLLVGTLGLIEVTRALAARQAPCRRILTAVTVASMSILLWTPILLAARRYSGGDVTAPAYYARPTIQALFDSYGDLLGWLIVPLALLVILAVVRRRPSAFDASFNVMALLLAAVPLIVFIFALVISHSYAGRYVLAGALGTALLVAAAATQLGDRARPAAVVLLAVLLVGNLWRAGGELAKTDRRDALAVADAAPGTLPIVTGNGLRYFEIAENARPAIARRIVFLDVPDTASPDPTNRNQVLRWKAIDRDLRVEDARTFVCATPAFLLFAQPSDGPADILPQWLSVRAPSTGPSLTAIRPKPCV